MTNYVIQIKCWDRESKLIEEIIKVYCYAKVIRIPEGTKEIALQLFEAVE